MSRLVIAGKDVNFSIVPHCERGTTDQVNLVTYKDVDSHSDNKDAEQTMGYPATLSP